MDIHSAVLAIDQGTTSTRAILFDQQAREITSAHQEFNQYYPRDGWVEHDPDDLWHTTLRSIERVLQGPSARHSKVVAIGITNQRETTLVWDRDTGEPVYNAIVWQDRRTAAECERLRQQVPDAEIQARSGLLIDPYFSATKIAWILDNIDGARERAEQGRLLFGTVDTWLIWKLTGGAVHATDATNASRTNLYNIHCHEWDDELLRIFRVPAAMLPEVRDSSAEFGTTLPSLTCRQAIPILGVAGDQQAAAIGQCCFAKGEVKATYGTGCFVLMNTGHEPILSTQKLLTTIAWQLDGKVAYALEGSIFIAGAAVQWLRDELGVIRSAAETEVLARRLTSNKGVYMVPAFTGLGVPWWRPDARAAIVGLTRGAGKAELARAALEAVCYQTSDLFAAMEAEGLRPTSLRVDGGMVANNWMLQFLADVLETEVLRPAILETTALGVAYLAGRKAGLYGDFQAFDALWHCTAEFRPTMADPLRQQLLGEWARAVQRVTL
mgnify:FL=1